MTTLHQGDFTIDPAGTHVTIGDGHGSKNKLAIAVTNNGTASARVKVTVKVGCGATPEALLRTNTEQVTATYTINGTKDMSPGAPSDNHREWYPGGAWGIPLDPGQQLQISLSGFESNTPPGKALVDVLVQVKKGVWSPAPEDVPAANRTLEVDKGVEKPDDPKIHYFTANPDFILHAGQKDVAVGFYATGFHRIVLYRNNQEVQVWTDADPKTNAGSGGTTGIAGTFSDQPSITTVYRLVGKVGESAKDTQYRTVHVISPGWNQIALPQGYPARLFVTTDFSGGDLERLYGIFIDGNRKAALYSSGTGVDDWREETHANIDFPQHMATSPGVAYDNKLWLIGGSCVDSGSPSSEVWFYDPEEKLWRGKENRAPQFPDDMRERAGHACVVFPRMTDEGNIDEEIWVLGGYNNGMYFDDVWKLQGNTWKTLKKDSGDTPHWSGRFNHAAVSYTPDPTKPSEVWIYGGDGKETTGLKDVWSTQDGETWTQKTKVTGKTLGIIPPPGVPLGAAMVTYGSPGSQRLFLGGTFRDEAAGGNRISSFIFERQWRNEVWEARPVGDGWEQFEGSSFYMQAIAFNRFLFVWSLHTAIDVSALPKLNILIPS